MINPTIVYITAGVIIFIVTMEIHRYVVVRNRIRALKQYGADNGHEMIINETNQDRIFEERVVSGHCKNCGQWATIDLMFKDICGKIDTECPGIVTFDDF